MAIAALGPFRPKSTQTVDDVKRYLEPFNAFAENGPGRSFRCRVPKALR
jgi:hypothetical protein